MLKKSNSKICSKSEFAQKRGGVSLNFFFYSFSIESSLLLDSKALWQQLRVVLQRSCNKYMIFEKIIITVGLWLMKLYTNPPSMLTLVTWVPQSKLGFGQTPHIGWASGLRLSAKPNHTVCSLACRWPL